MTAIGGLLVAAASGSLAHAQQSPAPVAPTPASVIERSLAAPLEVIVTPFVWAMALEGSATAGGFKSDVDVGFSDILDNLNGAVLVEAELRKGAFGLLLDAVYANLSDDQATGRDRIKIDGEANQFIFLTAATYRVGTWTLAEGDGAGPFAVSVDPYVGARLTYLDVELTGKLDLPLLAIDDKLAVDKDKIWVDPLIGLRTIFSLGERWNVTFAGDIGGTDPDSDYSWQALGVAGYRFSLFAENDARAMAGYRALYQKYRDGNGRDEFEWDITMHGPIIGLSVDF